MHDYSTDVDALAWARGIIQREIDWARKNGNEFLRKYANMLQMRLLGGQGCVITAFDARNVELLPLIRKDHRND